MHVPGRASSRRAHSPSRVSLHFRPSLRRGCVEAALPSSSPRRRASQSIFRTVSRPADRTGSSSRPSRVIARPAFLFWHSDYWMLRLLSTIKPRSPCSNPSFAPRTRLPYIPHYPPIHPARTAACIVSTLSIPTRPPTYYMRCGACHFRTPRLLSHKISAFTC